MTPQATFSRDQLQKTITTGIGKILSMPLAYRRVIPVVLPQLPLGIEELKYVQYFGIGKAVPLSRLDHNLPEITLGQNTQYSKFFITGNYIRMNFQEKANGEFV